MVSLVWPLHSTCINRQLLQAVVVVAGVVAAVDPVVVVAAFLRPQAFCSESRRPRKGCSVSAVKGSVAKYIRF